MGGGSRDSEGAACGRRVRVPGAGAGAWSVASITTTWIAWTSAAVICTTPPVAPASPVAGISPAAAEAGGRLAGRRFGDDALPAGVLLLEPPEPGHELPVGQQVPHGLLEVRREHRTPVEADGAHPDVAALPEPQVLGLVLGDGHDQTVAALPDDGVEHARTSLVSSVYTV